MAKKYICVWLIKLTFRYDLGRQAKGQLGYRDIRAKRRLAISTELKRLPLNFWWQVYLGLSVLKSWHFFFELWRVALLKFWCVIHVCLPSLLLCGPKLEQIGEAADVDVKMTQSRCLAFVQNTEMQQYKNTETNWYWNTKERKGGGKWSRWANDAESRLRSGSAFVHKWADSISRANTAGNRRIPPCQQWTGMKELFWETKLSGCGILPCDY